MPEAPKQLKVFLCHSSTDKPVVRELYQRLSAENWIDVWLDEEKLFPGQDWNLEIEKAVEAAHAILVCLSNNSITKEGYVQREVRIVLDYADYKPEGTLYLIPVRLEACDPPRRLRPWHYADYFPVEGRARAYERLLGSLRMRAAGLGISIKQPAVGEHAPVTQQKSPERDGAKTPIDENKFIIGGMEFRRIPKGAFIMGSKNDDKEASDDEKPQHPLEIAYDYWLARFTVTNAQFEQFAKSSGYQTTAEQLGSAYGYTGSKWEDIEGANWQHPRGPRATLPKKPSTRSFRFHGWMPSNIVNGQIKLSGSSFKQPGTWSCGCRRRLNGKKPHAVRMAIFTPGATNLIPNA